VTITATLGRADSRWDLEVTTPEGGKIALNNLGCDPAWREARWVGFSFHGADGTSYYLDNVKMENK
jgi:hypothetical protein